MFRFFHEFVSAKTQGGDATVASKNEWNAAHKAATTIDAKTGAYSIVDADNGKIIRATGSSAQTFTLPAASGLLAGWSVLVENRSTGVGDAGELIIDPNGTDTIDGLAAGAPIYTWPDSIHLIYRTGSTTWESIVLRGGVVEVTDTAGDTLHWPSNASRVDFHLWGAGGGGSSGQKGATGSNRYGGSGGGGGALCPFQWNGNAVAASTAITATAGTGGAGGTTNTGATIIVGADGTNSTLTISGLPTMYGFGGSRGTSYPYGGGGGSFLGAPSNMVYPGSAGSNVDYFNGGTHHYGSLSGAAGTVMNGSGPYCTVFGGGGGTAEVAVNPSAASIAGGRSVYGGAGGGSGGSISSAGTAYAGSAGGGTAQVVPFSNLGGGGAGGATGANGTAGSAGGAFGPGTAGGGAGASSAASGGTGGAGGRACGGGGGGATNTGAVAGAGGAGGNGFIRAWYW